MISASLNWFVGRQMRRLENLQLPPLPPSNHAGPFGEADIEQRVRGGAANGNANGAASSREDSAAQRSSPEPGELAMKRRMSVHNLRRPSSLRTGLELPHIASAPYDGPQPAQQTPKQTERHCTPQRCMLSARRWAARYAHLAHLILSF